MSMSSGKRIVGRPLAKGAANPQSRAARESRVRRIAELEEEVRGLRRELERRAEVDGGGGKVTAERMGKVMGQRREGDAGPLEGALREWLERDPRGYIQEMERKERAAAGVAALVAERDRLAGEVAAYRSADGGEAGPGGAAALALIERLLGEAGS